MLLFINYEFYLYKLFFTISLFRKFVLTMPICNRKGPYQHVHSQKNKSYTFPCTKIACPRCWLDSAHVTNHLLKLQEYPQSYAVFQ